MVTVRNFSPSFIRFVLRTARGLTVVTALFSLAVCILMIANYVQLETARPLDSDTLLALRSTYRSNQTDEQLKSQIRVFDLLARRAFFTRTVQLKVGGYLLIGGTALLLLSLRAVSFFTRRLPDPQVSTGAASSDGASRWLSGVLARRALMATGVVMAAVAFAAIILSLKFQRNLLAEAGAGTSDRYGHYAYRASAAENWPGFRGLDGTSLAASQSPPVEWDGQSGKNIRWKTALALPGFNSPIVWQDRVFLSGADKTGSEGKIIQEVYCLDALSGDILWTQVVGPFTGSPAEPPRVDPETGYAAPTMAADGERVFAAFATGDLICLDFNGGFVWGMSLGVPDLMYGYSSSLLIYGDLLIVQYDHSQGARVMAIDTLTGEFVWETLREVGESYASPILADSDERTELVLIANPLFAAYDPVSGSELWRTEGADIYGDVGASPGFGSGTIVSLNPLPAAIGNIFAVDAATGELMWDVYHQGLGSNPVSSPLIVEQYVIIGSDVPLILCLDVETGEDIWIEEFYEEGDRFYASAVFADGKVYLLNRTGVMRIFIPSASFELIGSPAIHEHTDATPAFKEGRIYIRGDDHLYCVENLDG